MDDNLQFSGSRKNKYYIYPLGRMAKTIRGKKVGVEKNNKNVTRFFGNIVLFNDFFFHFID